MKLAVFKTGGEGLFNFFNFYFLSNLSWFSKADSLLGCIWHAVVFKIAPCVILLAVTSVVL